MTPARVTEGEQITTARIAAIVVRYVRLLVGTPLMFAFLTIAVVLILPRTYTTAVSFTPSGPSISASQMSSLAAQFGVQLPGSGGASSPEFYADLVRSDEFLRRLAGLTYERRSDDQTVSGTFAEISDIEKSTPAKTLDAAVRELRDDVLTVDPRITTGVVRVSIQTRWPEVSTQIATRILAQIDSFNMRSHQEQAVADQRFAEERVSQSGLELRRAEDQMQAFLRRNREFRSDPELVFEHERLERDVAMRQTVFTTLSQTLEQARIEAVRNTPSIRLIERGAAPIVPDRRQLIAKVIVALALGFATALVLAFVIETAAREAAEAGLDSEVGRLLAAINGIAARGTSAR